MAKIAIADVVTGLKHIRAAGVGGREAISMKSLDTELRVLVQLPVVLSRVGATDDLPGALYEVLVSAVGRLDPLNSAVLDVIFRLELLRTGRDALDAALLSHLYASVLGARRQHLRENWQRTIEAHAVKPLTSFPETWTQAQAPGDVKLRDKIEESALEALAKQLISLPVVETSQVVRPSTGRSARRRVVVAGGAVMDMMFRLPGSTVPAAGQSEQATLFKSFPGGKALTQAVACARLGLETSLIAAVGDDEFGRQIVRYLDSENVDTDLLKWVPGGSTPVTGVISYQNGSSFAIGWKNEQQVRLDPDDFKGRRTATLASADVALITFELTHHSVNAVLESIDGLQSPPEVIVTPAPPFEANLLVHGNMNAIKFLVADDWEARKMLPDLAVAPVDDPVTAQDTLARAMHEVGVGTMILPSEGQAFTFTAGEQAIATQAWAVQKHDETGERDALCAALAFLIANGEEINEKSLHWATAAMATSSMRAGVVESMPTLNQIERFVLHRDPGAWLPDQT